MHMYFHHNDIKRYLSMSKQNRYLVATIVKEKSESSDDSEEENSVEGIVQQEEDADSNHEHSQDIAIIGDHSHEMLSKSTELIMSMIQQINSRTMEKPDDESGVLFSSLGKNMSNISHDIKKIQEAMHVVVGEYQTLMSKSRIGKKTFKSAEALLNEEIRACNQALKNNLEQMHTFKNLITHLETECEKTRTILDEKTKKCSDLQFSSNELQNDYEKMKLEVENTIQLKSEIAQLQMDNNDLQELVHRYTDECNAKIQTLSECKEEYEQSSQEKDSQIQNMTEFISVFKTEQFGKISNLTVEIGNLTSLIETEKQSMTKVLHEHETEKQDWSAKNTEFIANIQLITSKSKEETDDLKAKITKTEQDFQAVSLALEQQKNEAVALSTEFHKQLTTIVTFSDAQKLTLQSINTEKMALEMSYEELEAENDSLKMQYQQCIEENEKLVLKLEALNQDLSKDTPRGQDSETISRYESKQIELQNELVTSQKKLDEMQLFYGHRISDLGAENTVLHSVKDQNQKLEADIKERNVIINTSELKIKQQKKEIEALKRAEAITAAQVLELTRKGLDKSEAKTNKGGGKQSRTSK